MAIGGKFENYKNENLKDFLLALAKSQGKDGSKIEENQARFGVEKSVIEVTGSGDSYTITSTHLGKTFSVNLKSGAEFDDKLGELVIKSVPTISGNKIAIKSLKDGNHVGGRDYEFTDSELVVTFTANSTPIVAKSYYKKL